MYRGLFLSWRVIIKEQLYLTIPDGKPPFIGIAYDKDGASFCRRDNGFFSLHNPKVDMIIESAADRLFITMLLQRYAKVAWYNPTYLPGELRAWLKTVRKADKINFGHVEPDDTGGYKVARSEAARTPMFIPLARIIIMDSETKEVIRLAKPI